MKTLLCLSLSGLAFATINLTNLYAQSPGDTIGWTGNPYQTNGSTGRRVVLDNTGCLHFTWMWYSQNETYRGVRYNCVSPNFPSPWHGEGTLIGDGGFPQISVTEDDHAVIAFHRAPIGAESLYVATDIFQCQGTFDYRHPPNRLGTSPVNKLLWPYLTVDRNNRIHVVATTNATDMSYFYRPVGYTRSNNGGTTWTALAAVDTIRTLSAIIVSSKVSDKVAIVYCHPCLDDTTGARNNIYYIESTDGITWPWVGRVNLTNYHQNNDSLYAWNEVSAVYDYHDNLHIVWPAQYVSGPINSIGNGNGVFYYNRAHLYHWDATSNIIHSFASFDSTWPDVGCDMGAGNFVFNRISIAATPSTHSNLLAVIYTSWDSTDCSASGFANGDVYLNLSWNDGATWTPKTNVTNSHSPNCEIGDCFSDLFPAMAEVMGGDASAYIFYVSDRTGNGSNGYSGIDNPMLYYQWSIAEAEDITPLPSGYSLSQNYPNPFNAQTIIKYNLPEKALIALSIYDLLGRKITTLFNGISQPGAFEINWNASAYPSGVYFARLQTGEKSQSIKMALLK
jgi:hypothetical protein